MTAGSSGASASRDAATSGCCTSTWPSRTCTSGRRVATASTSAATAAWPAGEEVPCEIARSAGVVMVPFCRVAARTPKGHDPSPDRAPVSVGVRPRPARPPRRPCVRARTRRRSRARTRAGPTGRSARRARGRRGDRGARGAVSIVSRARARRAGAGGSVRRAGRSPRAPRRVRDRSPDGTRDRIPDHLRNPGPKPPRNPGPKPGRSRAEVAAEAAARHPLSLFPAELAGDRLERGHRGRVVLGRNSIGDPRADAVDDLSELLLGGAPLVGQRPGAVALSLRPSRVRRGCAGACPCGRSARRRRGVSTSPESALSSIQSRRSISAPSNAAANSRVISPSTVRSQ